MSISKIPYDPAKFETLTFHDAPARFLAGIDTPSAFLERCLETIEAREPVVMAWQATRIEGARSEARLADARYRDGKPLSPLDGMPVGVKDLIQTRDLPTGEGIAGNEDTQGRVDSASIQALRAAGAIVLGKLVTTELGGGHPSVTTNPFDNLRTPGGSSSGCAAAIGSKMLPVAIGTQVGGSVIRPAGYCGNFAMKPTFGALHRGERQGYSQSCLGIHAGSVRDVWRVSYEIGRRAGGDPGHPGLFGAAEPPRGNQPARLVVMESEGWSLTDSKTKEAFSRFVENLRERGVAVLDRRDHPYVELFEESLENSAEMVSRILAFENRWALENLTREYSTLTPGTLSMLEKGRRLTVDNYREALHWRQRAQWRFSELTHVGEAVISLTAPGPAPAIGSAKAGESGPLAAGTGNPVFALPASLLLAPAMAVPLLSVEAMPVGIQLVGQPHDDYRIASYAQWIVDNVQPVSVA